MHGILKSIAGCSASQSRKKMGFDGGGAFWWLGLHRKAGNSNIRDCVICSLPGGFVMKPVLQNS